MSDWCILRCSGRHTMGLAESLAKDGFEVWTPIETVRIRVPRMNAKREVRLPIMPSYVFARARHLIDMLEMSGVNARALMRKASGHTPRDVKIGDTIPFDAAMLKAIIAAKAHPSFTVVRTGEKLEMVEERHLKRLRELEQRRTPLLKASEPLQIGIGVKLTRGGFQGMAGKVERSDCKHTIVSINDRYTVKIATSLLDLNELCTADIPAAKRAA